MAGLTFRVAAPEDAEEIAVVHAASWQAAYLGMLPHDVMTGLAGAQGTEFWRRVLCSQRRADAVVVAELEHEVLGFISFGPLRERMPGYSAEFYALYVQPEAQGCGIGTGLMAHAARVLIRQRWIGGVVWVLERNESARRFYAQLGGLPLGIPKPLRYGGRQYDDVQEVGYGWPDLRRAPWVAET